jgi:hypothetical protein
LLEEKFSFFNFRVVNNLYQTLLLSPINLTSKRIGLLIWISRDFDGSVNIIFTDDKNNPGIINSRFKRIDSSRLVRLIVPVQKTVTFILTMTGIE